MADTAPPSWQRACPGNAHLVAITGEAGIGKTRLAEELLTWARSQGSPRRVCTLLCRAWRLGLHARHRTPAHGVVAAPSFPDWTTSGFPKSHGCYQSCSTSDLGCQRRNPWRNLGSASDSLMRWRELSGRRRTPPAPNRRPAMERPRHAGMACLSLASQRRCPVAGYRHPCAPTRPMVTIRIVSWSWPLPILTKWTEITLSPLDHAETQMLAVNVAGHELSPEKAATLYADTEGNPLFVVETVRAEATETAGETLPAHAAPGPDEVIARLPTKVHTVIRGRLARLSPRAHELANLAAVAGRSFSFDVLHLASEQDTATLADGIEELLNPASSWNVARTTTTSAMTVSAMWPIRDQPRAPPSAARSRGADPATGI